MRCEEARAESCEGLRVGLREGGECGCGFDEVLGDLGS